MLKNLLKDIILSWSEVWAPLIPLVIYFIRKPKANWARPIAWYLIITILLILCADVIWKRETLQIKDWVAENLGPFLLNSKKEISNNVFYNLNSISRFLFFAWFFNYLGSRFVKLNRFVPWFFILLAAVNYIFFKNINDFSSRQFTTEGVLMLLYCLFYFHQVILADEPESPASNPHFWVVAGLTLFTAVNFFIVLFYTYLMTTNAQYATDVWYVQNINYIILNLFIALALYRAK